MSFNIDVVAAGMLSAVKGAVAEDWPQVKSTAERFLQNKKERLTLIAELRIKGEITQAKFESRLLDEKLILEAELNALAVLSKAIAQNAANAALDILGKAVNAAISAAI
jgi:hypothetical protein